MPRHSGNDTTRALRVRAASDAVFNVLTDVALDVALEALARVTEEFQQAQREPDVVLSADEQHLRSRAGAAPGPRR